MDDTGKKYLENVNESERKSGMRREMTLKETKIDEQR